MSDCRNDLNEMEVSGGEDVQQVKCAHGGEGGGADNGEVYAVKEPTKEVHPAIEKEDDSGPRYICSSLSLVYMVSLTMGHDLACPVE